MKTRYKILIAKIIFNIINFFLRKSKIICTRNKINYSLNLNEAIDLYIFIFGKFETEIVDTAYKLKMYKFKKIIDIGANNGIQSLQFAQKFKSSQIYSAEPTNYAYKKFKDNLMINSSFKKRIFPFQFYINNDSSRPKKIHSSWDLKSNKSKHPEHQGIRKSISNSQNISLDKFLYINKIKKVDFIKLDVDGLELKVLMSGKKFLSKNKPVIFMELASYLYPEFGYSVQDLIFFLEKLNYNFYEINPLKKITKINDYVLSIKDGSSKNIMLM